MSKRGAEEYITKEHGSTPNDSSEATKVKMATAAQLAKRKMAVPKSRAGRMGQSPVPGAGVSNPFAATNTFGATQNNQPVFQNPTGGITFGASQSFPPSETTNGGFNFAVPGQSTSFTFGQPTPNNPFANMNGSASTEPSSGQDSNDTIMESPQKKPAFGSNLFGSNSVGSSTPSAGFSFGQPNTQPSSQSGFGFGQAQGFGGTSSGTSLFGQNTAKPAETNPTNLFGKSTDSKNETSSLSSSFGQSTGASTQTQSPGFGFGSTTAAAPSSTPAFSFGQPTTAAPSSKPAFSFGQSATKPTTNGTLFGASKEASAPASQPTTSTPLFGSTSGAPASNNVFGGFGNTKSVEPSASSEVSDKAEQSKSSLFSQISSPAEVQSPTDSTTQDPPKLNPFAGLFGQPTPKQSDTVTAPPAESSKPLFNFGAPSQPSNLFSMPKSATETTPRPLEPSPAKALFTFGTPASTPNSNLFSPAKSSVEAPATSNPFAGLKASKSDAKEQSSQPPLFGVSKEAKQNKEVNSQSMPAFGESATSKPTPTSQPTSSKPFGGFKPSQPSTSPSSSGQSELNQGSQTKSAPTSLFGTTSTSKQPASSLDFSAATKDRPDAHSPSSTAASHEATADGPKRSVNTYPPTRIPPYLNGDDYKAYDSNFRLHSLNREFQKRIASLDPSRNDFENIVRNYVAARESIGESIGLYTRNIVGLKRKPDDDDEYHNEDLNSAKRSKPTEATPAKPMFGSGQSSSSTFQPIPSSTLKSNTNSSEQSSTKSTFSGASSASAIFNSMTPNHNSASATSSNKNPFADLAKSNNSTSNAATSTPVFSFGTSLNSATPAGSTTPTKSPPKKSTFEMPKFAAPTSGTNFMDAFKKQSEQSVAKFEKEAKAKRKAEEFDSDEDDEAEWERKYAEEENAKKAKLAAVAQKGFTPSFGNGIASSGKTAPTFGAPNKTTSSTTQPGAGFGFGAQSLGKTSEKPISISDNDASGEDDGDEEDASGASGDGDDEEEEEEEVEDGDDEAGEDDLPEDEVTAEDENDEDDDFETTLANSRSQGRSLFDRVTPNPNLQKNSVSTAPAPAEKDPSKKPNVFGSVFGKSTPEAPAFSPLTPAGSKGSYVPSTTFNFTPTPPITSPTPTPGASIFAGGLMKDGPITGEGLFGSRPSTPSNADKSKTNVFGNLGTPSATSAFDQTWKKGSEIKFGTSTTEAPLVSITAPSPLKAENKPFGSLFGATSSSMNNSSTNAGVGFNFSQSPVPGFLAAASHLAGGSGTNSGFSSRATSPGTTDNESVATNEEDYSNDTQVSLMETRPGEENEMILYEIRTKALRWYTEKEIEGTKFTKGWNVAGLGTARLLKHKESGKTRLVLRAEPGANIILNTNLQPEVKYEVLPSGNAGGAVKFNVFTSEGGQGWTLKVKTAQQAQELAKLMEENKQVKA